MRNNSKEEIFDILIREALIEKWDKELDELKLQTMPHEFSKSFNKRIQRIQFSIASKNNIKKAGKIALKAVASIAIVMGVCFGGLLTQPKIYAAVSEVIKEIFSTHDSYYYQKENDSIVFDKDKKPAYIPNGYELRSVYYAKNNVSLTYESIDENFIYCGYGLAENSLISMDNERHTYSELKYDDITYYFYEAIEKNDFSTLIWYDDGYYYSIDAQLGCDEIVKIAKSIK